MILRIRMLDRTYSVHHPIQDDAVSYISLGGNELASARYDDGWRCFDYEGEAIMSGAESTSAWPTLEEFEKEHFINQCVVHLLGDPT